ncbi:MAG TPA: glycosyltransferase family 2 protein [Solirubrobacteraceae bacterium]|nr:glycosyltransferase family 2 protein [Solirubrobacteraceae bacterium]
MISFVIISKDEPLLSKTLTAVAGQAARLDEAAEVIVVDASSGKLRHIQAAHAGHRWIDYRPPNGVNITIPHQRNIGVRHARGETIVFTDSGCIPVTGWADALTQPIRDREEEVTVGRTLGRGSVDLYDAHGARPLRYVAECPTINVAFTRRAYEAVGGFDESFEYGSDVDFSWRLVDAGFRLRSVPDAVVTADWGTRRRQIRRAWSYGRARARLYSKHRSRANTAWKTDPALCAYVLFLLGLPLTIVFRPYPALLLISAVRNRRTGMTLTVADHLAQGAGFLCELVSR